ncbi:MAG: hypothetical protein IIU16_00235, partial [Bacteroidales bacterium]|nr:hypothetical protein [Bacteroidales bacterium]
AYVLDARMAKTPEAVYKLLDEVWQPSLAAARAELADIKAIAKEDGIETIIPADWRYYATKARAQKYSYDEGKIMEYLQYDNVRDGIFYVANKLFGVSFTRVEEIPLPHPRQNALSARMPTAPPAACSIWICLPVPAPRTAERGAPATARGKWNPTEVSNPQLCPSWAISAVLLRVSLRCSP